jgi:hypothetical protein
MDEPRMHTNERESDLGSRRSEIPKSEAAIPEFIQEMAAALGTIHEIEAVAWCGSVAMGVADAYSDFDFYVYTNAQVPVESRRAAILDGSLHSQLNNKFWELEDEWIDREARRFNAMYRPCDFVLGQIDARLDRYSADLGTQPLIVLALPTDSFCMTRGSG